MKKNGNTVRVTKFSLTQRQEVNNWCWNNEAGDVLDIRLSQTFNL